MKRIFNPQPKEAQLSRSPGGNRNKAKSTKAVGSAFERTVAVSFGKQARVNSQAGAGGGIGRADVTALGGWACECKATKTLAIPEWWRRLNAEHAANVRKMLAFLLDGEILIVVRREDLESLAADLLESAGAEIYFPE